MTDQPIKKSISKLEAAGRMVQWEIELRQFDIKYHPRTAIKAQALADFIAKFTIPEEDGALDEGERWTIQANRSSAQKMGGVRVIIITPEGDTLKYGVQLQFPATNNKVEYKAILTRLRIKKALCAKNLLLQSDSKLVVGQTKEEYEAKEERMQKYLRLTRHFAQEFDRVEFIQIPKSQNVGAKKIAKQASSEARSMSVDLKMEV
ncbi:uncharacterized protein LOC142626249 [Castanea sativa]|uniref:uncharacterized protein LOC142626249 n=1 Tax=Castanea sativa TaxID=21020 RepID=UPI003F65149A